MDANIANISLIITIFIDIMKVLVIPFHNIWHP